LSMAQVQMPMSFANVLKRSYQTYKGPGGEAGKSQGGGLSGGAMVPRAFQSFSANCVMADFSGLNLSKGEALGVISEAYEGVEGVKFTKQGMFVEVAFESRGAVMAAMGKELQVGGVVVPVTRCFSPKQSILPVAVHGIPIYPKEDTYKEVVEVFGKFGKVQELKFHCYDKTNIRMDSCSVMLDRTDMEKVSVVMPRRVEIFGKFCDLFWREAKPFCRYCKDEGHFVQKCPKLEQKKNGEGKQVVSKRGEVGAVVGGSVKSVHAPAALSKRGGEADAERHAQVAVMEKDEQYHVQASLLMEKDNLSTEVANQFLETSPPALPSMMGDEPILEQTHKCVERSRNVMEDGDITGGEVSKVSKELGAKRRRLIRAETSSEASDDQSASEFLACTPTRKGESYLSLMSQLESLKGDMVHSGMSDSDEDMEGDGEDVYVLESDQGGEESLVRPHQMVSQPNKEVSHISRGVISLSGVEIDSEDLPSFL
jgi:hypothetical protein